ncbi:MAG: ribosome silencing factor [Acidobacteria bacterium]|nr:MAG: ribosome silencing factor [Acidobacteriota bacterium]
MRITRELQAVVESIQEKKGEEIRILNLQNLTSFTDYFVICTGESEPQIKAISKNVEEKMSKMGLKPDHVEGRFENGWVLMDYDDFIVHIFSPEKRSYYDIERLWADAPRLDASAPFNVMASAANS